MTALDTQLGADTVTASAGVSRYDQLYSKIPFSDEAKAAALQQVEEAHYKLGNIYKFDLKEDENAAETFKRLISRFPNTEYYAEALYELYLIYKSLDSEQYITYKDQLLSQFPKSIYAKLVANPNYREESTASNEQLKNIYEVAYRFYREDNYDTASYIIDKALNEFDETAFSSQLRLLKVMITGKTEDISLYQYQLGEFIENYPDSDILPFAQKLLEASRNIQEKKRKRLGTQYVKYLEQSHYFVYVYESESGLTDLISQLINGYNSRQATTLKSSNLILNENFTLKLISDFEDKNEAMQYYQGFVADDPVNESIRNSKFYKFVITKDNFNIFYQSKELDAYLLFFEKNYLNGYN